MGLSPGMPCLPVAIKALVHSLFILYPENEYLLDLAAGQ